MIAYPYYACRTNNYGDIFTEYLFRRVFGIKLVNVAPSEAKLIGCGSIMACVNNDSVKHVFGTGIQHEEWSCDLTGKNVYALRGRLTKERCTGATYGCTIGDPGLLSHLFVNTGPRPYKLGIIPHEVDQEDAQVTNWRYKPDILVINILGGVDHVLWEVSQCQTIVSSCLHGLIIADSLGIPNHWVRLSDKLHGWNFKFRDYYSGFGIKAEPKETITVPLPFTPIRPGIWHMKRNLLAAAGDLARKIQGEINERA